MRCFSAYWKKKSRSEGGRFRDPDVVRERGKEAASCAGDTCHVLTMEDLAGNDDAEDAVYKTL